MICSMSLPLDQMTLSEYESWEDLRRELEILDCRGIEAVWGGEDMPADFPCDLIGGYHLTFYPDWLDFYREDTRTVESKFGSIDTAKAFYGGWGAEHLLNIYRADLERARHLGAPYVVFHVSDVSLEEGYTYCWQHTHREVIEAATEIVNRLMDGVEYKFEFLLENQWWPGFSFTDPELTAYMLERVNCPRCGIMRDTGHLMNCNTALMTQRDAAAYIGEMLDRHGDLCRLIRGVHLHQSLSGAYVRSHTGSLPPLPAEYMDRFGASYGHILQIDRHRPWDDPVVSELVERISPVWLTHELSGRNRAARFEAVRQQNRVLNGGRYNE